MRTSRVAAESEQRGGCRAFTLIELLITMSIIGVLLALMFPSLSRIIGTSRSFRCQMTMKNAAFDFQVFADSRFSSDRGDDSEFPDRFHIETFQEAMYGIDEFWAYGQEDLASLENTQADERTRCPEVSGTVLVRRDTTCSTGGVGPAESISFGYNIRLARRETLGGRGVRLAPVFLNETILDFGNVPLAIDIDGAMAKRMGVSPVFTGPSLDDTGPLASNRYWFPRFRHGAQTNISFIDGHVEATDAPLASTSFLWGFSPGR
jgi:prepilin-type N-terminal cleavage/methylation domain-containing protein/prepilin-type processing-associated H-X9-DG protein